MDNKLYDELCRHNLMRALIQCRVIAEAVSSESVQQEALKEAHENFLKNNGIKDDEAKSAYLQSCGLTKEDFDWQIALPLRIKTHCDAKFRHMAESEFLKRKNQLDRVVYSLVRLKDGGLARELFFRIDSKESGFADLASQYSEGLERNTCGIVGPLSLTKAHPELAERLRTSQAGELLHPFRIGEWWLLVRLEKYLPASFDDAMAEFLSKELFDKWVNEEVAIKMKRFNPDGVEAAAE